MENKYLPIGSVCTLNGKNKKMMIIGYYSVEFNGNLKINDYLGCVYPEGMLLPNQAVTFNHKDIEKIDFIGYKNDQFNIFMKMFDKLSGNHKDEEKEAEKFHRENDMVLTSSKSYSKLLFDENGVVMIAEPVKEKSVNREKDINSIKFDEDGIVIGIGKAGEVNNPFHRTFEKTITKNSQKTTDWNIFNKIEFDKNGTVISVDDDVDYKKEQMLNKIEFDENGTVIAVNSTNNTITKESEDKQNKLDIKFDENGTVISS